MNLSWKKLIEKHLSRRQHHKLETSSTLFTLKFNQFKHLDYLSLINHPLDHAQIILTCHMCKAHEKFLSAFWKHLILLLNILPQKKGKIIHLLLRSGRDFMHLLNNSHKNPPTLPPPNLGMLVIYVCLRLW